MISAAQGAQNRKTQAWQENMPSELSFSGAYVPQQQGAGARTAAASSGEGDVVDEAQVRELEQQVQARLRGLQRSTRWHMRRLLRASWATWRGSTMEVRCRAVHMDLALLKGLCCLCLE